MNTKQLKFFQLFAEMTGKADITSSSSALSSSIKALLDLDYSLAQDAWDYLCSVNEGALSASKDCGVIIGQTAFELFYNKAQLKCVKTIYDVPSIRKAVYMYNPSATTGFGFNIIVDTLVANKTAEAEDIFKCLIKNQHIEFGSSLKLILERVFIEILKKSSSKKIEMSKKLTTLLLTYIAKIKTDEKAMLEQRVRETL